MSGLVSHLRAERLFIAAAALVLVAVESMPNVAGWPADFASTALARGYAVPTRTFAPLFAEGAAARHWFYPALLATVGVGALLLLGWEIFRVLRRAPRAAEDLGGATAAPRLERTPVVVGIGLLALAAWTGITAKWALLDWTQFPAPVVVVQAFGLTNPPHEVPLLLVLFAASGRTLLSLAIALAIVWPLAVSAGLRVGRSPRVASILAPYTYTISALPPLVLFLVISHFISPAVFGEMLVKLGLLTPNSALVLMRDKEWLGNILLTAWALFWPIFSAACAAAEAADRRLVAAAFQLGAQEPTVRQKVIRPAARKNIYAGVETAVGIGLIILLYAEGRSGVGKSPIGWNAFFFPNLGELIDDTYDDRRFADLLGVLVFSMLLALVVKMGIRGLLLLRTPWLRRVEHPLYRALGRWRAKLRSFGRGTEESVVAAAPAFAAGGEALRFDRLELLYRRLNDLRPTPEAQLAISLENVEARYGGFSLLVRQLSVPRGAVVSVAGANGAGKTSLVELIAGLQVQDTARGRIVIDGRPTLDAGGWTADAATGACASLAYQDFALFQTMTLRENLCFGFEMRLRRARLTAEEKRRLRDCAHEALAEAVAFLGLPADPGFLRRYPSQISRGQQQRIVLGRALMSGNSLLLVDEGFANIDLVTRRRLAEGLRVLGKQIGLTMLFVSHDDPRDAAKATMIVHLASQTVNERLVGEIARIETPPADPPGHAVASVADAMRA